MRRPVDLATRTDDRAAVQEAAIAAAEAVAAAAAAEVACEAASTAQAAVETARAAAAKAAHRARQVAADAADVVAAAVTAQQVPSPPAPAAALSTRTGLRRAGGTKRIVMHRQASVDAAASQAAEAQQVARRVVLVAEAAAVAAVAAARVVAAQLNKDVAAVAEHVASVPPLGDIAALVRPRAPGLTPAEETAQAAAPKAAMGVAAATIGTMADQGASSHTIAAALNAGGSRTASERRWTAGTVTTMLHLLAAPAGLVSAEAGASSKTDAQLLAVAEDARERAEQDLDEAQRLGGLGSWSWDIATDEVTWSEQMYRLFGADPATFDATYEGFLACVHPDDREQVSGCVASVFQGAAGYEFDHRVRHPDGKELWLHARGAAARDEQGRPVRLYGTVIDRTPAKRAEQRDQQQSEDLARLAWHDSLTGLGNRSLLHDRLGHALTRRGQRVAVLLLDLDDFKTVNDISGHAAGDRLLVEVGTRLLHIARAGDTVARLGGDEFAIVIENGDPWQLAQRILEALAVPVLIGGRQVIPLASIGITTAEGVTDVDELLLQADVAMYAAKAAGKGRAERFEAAMADTVRLRTDLHEGLRGAVTRGEIVVHYQPIMNVGTQSMSRVEALVRWQRPDGLVSPAEFLPLAEETGLIVGIGHDVLRQTCAQMQRWLAADRGRSVSVNVSPVQLLAGDFADRTLEVVVDACVDPHQVVLEVTETLFLSTTPVLIEQLERLRRHGFQVSVDDFGTGYSSLGRLHRLPIDSIKIDKSFVDLIRTGGEFLPLIKSMIVMAHALNLDVTAEGVETAEQALRLVALGCDYLQGFHFARPSAVESAIGSAADQALEAWRRLRPAPPWVPAAVPATGT